jgi:hypothetical protein
MAFVSRYEEVTKDLLDMLVAAGFEMVEGYDGDDSLTITDNQELANFLTQVDESHLYVRKGKQSFRLFILLGNEFSEIVCDHTCNESPESDELSVVVSEHYDKWEKKQRQEKDTPVQVAEPAEPEALNASDLDTLTEALDKLCDEVRGCPSDYTYSLDELSKLRDKVQANIKLEPVT